jgi:hypothetical protein
MGGEKKLKNITTKLNWTYRACALNQSTKHANRQHQWGVAESKQQQQLECSKIR